MSQDRTENLVLDILSENVHLLHSPFMKVFFREWLVLLLKIAQNSRPKIKLPINGSRDSFGSIELKYHFEKAAQLRKKGSHCGEAMFLRFSAAMAQTRSKKTTNRQISRNTWLKNMFEA